MNRKTFLAAIAGVILIVSCCKKAERGEKCKAYENCDYPPRKPFYVTNTSSPAQYIVIDKNGNEYQFDDLQNKWSVGDTIQ